MAFEFIKRFFAIRTKCFEKFIEIIERKGCEFVTARPNCKPIGFTAECPDGKVGFFQHFVVFRSETLEGRKVLCKLKCEVLFGSTQGFVDHEERNQSSIKLFVIANNKLMQIKQRSPSITTELIGTTGKELDENDYQDLRKAAQKYNLQLS